MAKEIAARRPFFTRLVTTERVGDLYTVHFSGRLLLVYDGGLKRWFGAAKDLGDGPSLNRCLRRALRDQERLEVQDCEYEELYSIYYHGGVTGFAAARVTGAPVRRVKPPRVHVLPQGPDDV